MRIHKILCCTAAILAFSFSLNAQIVDTIASAKSAMDELMDKGLNPNKQFVIATLKLPV